MSTTSGSRPDRWERVGVLSALLQTILALISLAVAVITLLVSYLAWRHPTGFEELKQDTSSAIQSINPQKILDGGEAADLNGAHPSFSCASAALSVEKFICSDPDIASAEHEMWAAYRQALQRVSDQAALRADQRAFLKRLVGAPQIKDIYIQIYKQRTLALTRMGAPAGRSTSR